MFGIKESYPPLLVLAWIGAGVGAAVLGLRFGADITPLVDLLGASTAEGIVYPALGAAGIVDLLENTEVLDEEDFG
jgi:hypothetical protein